MTALDIPIPTSGGGASVPAVTFTEKGQGIRYAVVKSERIQDTVYGTGEPATWSDGNPKMKTVNTGIVVSGTAKIGEKQDDGSTAYRDLIPGETVRVFMKGAYEKEWFAAAAGRNNKVGDLVSDQYTENKPSSTPGYNPSKVHVVSIAEQPDAAVTAKAEALLADLASAAAAPLAVAADPFPAAAPMADAF